MKKNRQSHFTLSRPAKLILLIGSLLIIGAAVFVKVFAVFIFPGVEAADWYLYPRGYAFSFDDREAKYKIQKDDIYGTYSVRYIFLHKGNYMGVGDYIGSSKVDLEPYVDKEVRLTASYRKTFGTPLCWDATLCSKWSTKMRMDRKTVIDIEKVEVIIP